MEEFWDKTKRSLVRLAHFQKRNRIRRYSLPILLTALVFLTKHYLHPILGEHAAFLLMSSIVTATAWYGGLGPGILATILASAAAYYLYLSRDIDVHDTLGDLIMLGIFIMEGFLISIVSEARYEMENQKDEFIGFVSHELKNPLSSVRGFSQLISRSIKKYKDEKVEAYAREIRAQADKMLELINDLLDITKIEIGKFAYREEIFVMDDVVRDVILHQKILTPNRDIRLNIGRIKRVIVGDKYRLRQVLVNLLTNAIKYAPDTKPIFVKLKTSQDMMLISIKDAGIGISKDEQNLIFDRYYRTQSVQKRRSEGLGLGLFITDQIIKHHKGKIWVESQVGKGSTFYVSLPVTQHE